jgi:hypothetical protein
MRYPATVTWPFPGLVDEVFCGTKEDGLPKNFGLRTRRCRTDFGLPIGREVQYWRSSQARRVMPSVSSTLRAVIGLCGRHALKRGSPMNSTAGGVRSRVQPVALGRVCSVCVDWVEYISTRGNPSSGPLPALGLLGSRRRKTSCAGLCGPVCFKSSAKGCSRPMRKAVDNE